MKTLKDRKVSHQHINRVITKNGGCALVLIVEVEKALADIEAGRTADARVVLRKIKIRRGNI